jgi:hypothetical protein
MAVRLPIPTEHQEQVWLFRWAAFNEHRYPELRWMFAVPNGAYLGYRVRQIRGAKLKAEGLRRGVPDIFLPVAKRDYHGLFIEMKRVKGGKKSDAQIAWKEALEQNGYLVLICEGWLMARANIEWYLKGDLNA